jgi:hypothetical protein
MGYSRGNLRETAITARIAVNSSLNTLRINPPRLAQTGCWRRLQCRRFGLYSRSIGSMRRHGIAAYLLLQSVARVSPVQEFRGIGRGRMEAALCSPEPMRL